MKKSIDAKKLLGDVESEQSFWVNNGPIIRNLKEFAAAVRKLKPEQFMHHVNKEKNDFAKWVEEVIGDKMLAQKIKALKTKDSVAKAISQRVVALYKLAK